MHRKNYAYRIVAFFAVAFSLIGTACGSAPSGAEPPPNTISTDRFSHVHVLQVDLSGNLVLGDQEGMWVRDKNGTWNPTGRPLNRMMVTCVARTAATTLACTTAYAATKMYGSPRGVWRSIDGGRHWNRVALPDAEVTYLATNPNLRGTVIAFAEPDSSSGNGVGHGGVWVSRNSGRSWQRVSSALASAFGPVGLALLPGKPFTILVATTTGIHRSSDGGRTWSVSTLGGHLVVSMALSPLEPHTAYAGASNGIWRSTDGGQKWAFFHSAPPSYPLAAAPDALNDLYGFAQGSHPYVYRLTSTKHTIHGTAPPCKGQVAMAVDPKATSLVYYGCSFPLRIYKSKDSGRLWRKIL